MSAALFWLGTLAVLAAFLWQVARAVGLFLERQCHVRRLGGALVYEPDMPTFSRAHSRVHDMLVLTRTAGQRRVVIDVAPEPETHLARLTEAQITWCCVQGAVGLFTIGSLRYATQSWKTWLQFMTSVAVYVAITRRILAEDGRPPPNYEPPQRPGLVLMNAADLVRANGKLGRAARALDGDVVVVLESMPELPEPVRVVVDRPEVRLRSVPAQPPPAPPPPPLPPALECVVCMAATRSRACGARHHLCVCAGCAENLLLCPICRSDANWQEIHIS